MHKALFACLVIVGFLPAAAEADEIADLVMATAKQLQKQLPMQVDEKTTLLAVAAAGRQLKYSYRLDVNKDSLPADSMRQQAEKLRYNVCHHAQMRKMMGIGVSYSYLYTDRDGFFIEDIVIRSSDC